MRRFSPRVGLFVLLLVILLSFQSGVRGWIWGFGRRLVNPVTWSIGRVGEATAGRVRSLFLVSGLSERVRELEGEVAKLESERARLESVAQENSELRSALRLLPVDRFSLVSADVVGPATDDVTSALRINRGVTDGIAEGDPVIAADGVVVGRVATAESRSATVDLLTGGRIRVTARGLGTGAEGVVRGIRGLDVVIENVPKTQELRPQDRLVTTGTDGVFPPHLLIGTVASVGASENAVYQNGNIQLPLNLHRLRIVAVIIGP